MSHVACTMVASRIRSSLITRRFASKFRPRRPVSKNYRPVPTRKTKERGPSDPFNLSTPPRKPYLLGATEAEDLPDFARTIPKSDDPLVRDFGPEVAEGLRESWRDKSRGGAKSVESQMRLADYWTAGMGSTEERVMERRLGMEASFNEEDRGNFGEFVEKMVESQQFGDFELGDGDRPPIDDSERPQQVDPEKGRQVFGPWGETIVRVDRVQKVQKGGTMMRYRALVIGGNTRGVAGYGIAKAIGPKEAVQAASRKCKQNVFFFDRYKGSGIVQDLVGKHNSCKVFLRTVSKNKGLVGHPLVTTILVSFGVTDCSAKTHGNRNIYNIVYATFKALMRHESVETISMKRGKRFLPLDKARHIQME